jgi:hypothetical protein
VERRGRDLIGQGLRRRFGVEGSRIDHLKRCALPFDVV